MTEEKQKQMQQKYMELQMVDRQMRQIQQQIQALDNQIGELDAVQHALEEFKASKEGSDLFVTLTPGIFVKAKLEKNDAVLMNVGGGAVVQKNIPDAKGVLGEQVAEMRKVGKELAEQMEKLGETATKLQEELRKMIE